MILNHNVILDLGGHYIFNAVGSNSSIGVYVQNAENVTIQNGTIAGFNYGVYFNYLGGTKLNSGDIVRNLRLTDNLDGIFLVGATLSNVTNNQIINSSGVGGTGIYIAGGSNVATGNILNGFSAVLPPSETVILSRTRSVTATPVCLCRVATNTDLTPRLAVTHLSAAVRR